MLFGPRIPISRMEYAFFHLLIGLILFPKIVENQSIQSRVTKVSPAYALTH